jgi:hypothetical protein
MKKHKLNIKGRPSMLGFIFNERECKELEYLLRKEMDELIFDLNDYRIEGSLRKAMDDRYRIVFQMYRRIGKSKDITKYIRTKLYQ